MASLQKHDCELEAVKVLLFAVRQVPIYEPSGQSALEAFEHLCITAVGCDNVSRRQQGNSSTLLGQPVSFASTNLQHHSEIGASCILTGTQGSVQATKTPKETQIRYNTIPGSYFRLKQR